MYMSEIKKVPMTGKERSKKFYDQNKEKERLRKSEYYKQKRILAGLPPPVPRKAKEPIASSPIQPTPPSAPKPAICDVTYLEGKNVFKFGIDISA